MEPPLGLEDSHQRASRHHSYDNTCKQQSTPTAA